MKTYVRKKNFHCTPNLQLGPYHYGKNHKIWSKIMITFSAPVNQDMIQRFYKGFYRLHVTKTKYMIIEQLEAIQSDFTYCEGLSIFWIKSYKNDHCAECVNPRAHLFGMLTCFDLTCST